MMTERSTDKTRWARKQIEDKRIIHMYTWLRNICLGDNSSTPPWHFMDHVWVYDGNAVLGTTL